MQAQMKAMQDSFTETQKKQAAQIDELKVQLEQRTNRPDIVITPVENNGS